LCASTFIDWSFNLEHPLPWAFYEEEARAIIRLSGDINWSAADRHTIALDPLSRSHCRTFAACFDTAGFVLWTFVQPTP